MKTLVKEEINFTDLAQDDEEEVFRLSDQAVGALQMALIKCLTDQSDIVPIIKSWKLIHSDHGLVVLNPNMVKVDFEEEYSEYSE